MKIDALRAHLKAKISELQKDPSRLQIWVSDGVMTNNNNAQDLSHQLTYRVNVLVTDWAQDIDVLSVALLAFLKVQYQSTDTLEVKFETGINDHHRADVLFSLDLFEKKIVDADGAVVTCDPKKPVWLDDGDYTLEPVIERSPS